MDLEKATDAVDGKYAIDTETQCWEWLGDVSEMGIPSVKIDKKRHKAATVLWNIHVGPIPPHMTTWRICKSGMKCVRPDHHEIRDRATRSADRALALKAPPDDSDPEAVRAYLTNATDQAIAALAAGKLSYNAARAFASLVSLRLEIANAKIPARKRKAKKLESK